MFRALKRIFILLGLMAEKATETDTINEAVIERGIRDAKEHQGRGIPPERVILAAIGIPEVFVGPGEVAVCLVQGSRIRDMMNAPFHPLRYRLGRVIDIIGEAHQFLIPRLPEEGRD